jgi:hypothetical protein
MPFYKYFAIVGSLLLMVFVVSDVMLGKPAAAPRYNGSYFDGSIYTPRPAAVGARDEHRLSENVTPAERIQEAFDQFSITDGKRLKRTSSQATAIW